MSAPLRNHPATKVLLWKIGALGDVVMTTPLVRQLRKALPRARIDYLTGHGCAAVLEGNPHLDSVVCFDEHTLYRRKAAQLGEVLRQLRGYDAVFVLDKHGIFGLLAWAARVRTRVGFRRRAWEGVLHTHRAPYGAMRHEIDCYLDLAEAAGVAVDRADRRLELPACAPCALPAPYVVMINSGGANAYETSQARRMPDALFRELVAHCARHARPVFLGTREERSYYAAFATSSTIDLCGQTSLREAWAILKHAQAVYCTDTGLMHMAAAVNPNVTAVFGPTHPARKCPPGARWAWADEARYDARYELFGAVPKGRYFATLTLSDILEKAQPA
jgi:ADP-heptose:LPS heptosyltransferase